MAENQTRNTKMSKCSDGSQPEQKNHNSFFFFLKKAFVKSLVKPNIQIITVLLYTLLLVMQATPVHTLTHTHTHTHTHMQTLSYTHTQTSHACTHTHSLSLSGKVKSLQPTAQLKKCQYKKQKQMPDNINACTPTHTNTHMQVSLKETTSLNAVTTNISKSPSLKPNVSC